MKWISAFFKVKPFLNNWNCIEFHYSQLSSIQLNCGSSPHRGPMFTGPYLGLNSPVCWTVEPCQPRGGFPQLKRFGYPNVPPRMLDMHMSTHNDVFHAFHLRIKYSMVHLPRLLKFLKLPQDLRCNLFVFLRLFCPILHWTRAFLGRVGPPSNHRPPAPMAVKWHDSYVRWVTSNQW